MATRATPAPLAAQARHLYVEALVKGIAGVVQDCCEAAHLLLERPTEHQNYQIRRDLLERLLKGAAAWHLATVEGLRHALQHGAPTSMRGEATPAQAASGAMSLVDDDTIEREIMASRLALAIMDRAASEFGDLAARVASLGHHAELDTDDLLRAHVAAHILVDAWRSAGQTLQGWRELRQALHDGFAELFETAYQQANAWLIERNVLPETDLRTLIRRTAGGPAAASAVARGRRASDRAGGADAGPEGGSSNRPEGPAARLAPAMGRGSVGDETRMMTRTAGLQARNEATAVLGRLNNLVGKQVPSFGQSTVRAHPVSPGLARAIDAQQGDVRQRAERGDGLHTVLATVPAVLEDLQQRKQALKKAAATPEERATIEIVALLFQSILTEEHIPATVRVWFARLQMPVLRVAVGEPDFFATLNHPARQLIDRMGACVMGFDASAVNVGDALEKEIKRVVQVVEAYPDTGRRVFQTVLIEFEKFLEHYFSSQNETTRKGVSLAQQVEQRETLAIQYTIELRRMLNEVPVQEGVREFLFHVWADVLATMAVRHGPNNEQTRIMKRAAADLIWSASAKVTRDERAEVIRKLPPLLKLLREGMSSAGVDAARQDEHLQTLNDSLAAAFTARAAPIPDERLKELMERLETLEELLPEAHDVAIDESLVLDISGHESSELEVVSDGGSMPTPAMVSWARDLQVGSWYMLDYRGRNEPVQLAWHGLRKQLSLFVTPQGRCVLFQQHRLASFLQAGLLLLAQDEALTVRASRDALAKLDADASRLLA